MKEDDLWSRVSSIRLGIETSQEEARTQREIAKQQGAIAAQQRSRSQEEEKVRKRAANLELWQRAKPKIISVLQEVSQRDAEIRNSRVKEIRVDEQVHSPEYGIVAAVALRWGEKFHPTLLEAQILSRFYHVPLSFGQALSSLVGIAKGELPMGEIPSKIVKYDYFEIEIHVSIDDIDYGQKERTLGSIGSASVKDFLDNPRAIAPDLARSLVNPTHKRNVLEAHEDYLLTDEDIKRKMPRSDQGWPRG